MEVQQNNETPSIQTRKVTTHRKKTLKRSLQKSLHKLFPSNTNNEELLEESIPVLYEIFNTYAPLSKITPSFRNFYDICSGLGKVPLLMAKQHSFLKTIGIESDSEKVVLANTALNKIRDESLRKRIEVYCISILDSSLNYNNACWILLSNYTMTYELQEQLIEKLVNEVKSGCIIISFKQIYNTNFNQLNYISLPTTISADSKVYVYSRV
jgi:hypothetical protein